MPEAGRPVSNRPVDVVVRPGAPPETAPRVVVGTSVAGRPLPSNLWIFDTTEPEDPHWVGAASVSDGAVDGTLLRLAEHRDRIYALVQRKGVVIVDLDVAESLFEAPGDATANYAGMILGLNTEGQGWAFEATESVIPIPVDASAHWVLSDFDVTDAAVDGRQQPVVLVAGENWTTDECRLIVGRPHGTGGEQGSDDLLAWIELSLGDPPDEEPLCPVVIAIGRSGGRDIAALGVGKGTSFTNATEWGLAIYSIDDPLQPELLSYLALEDMPDLSDIVLDGPIAVLASRGGGSRLVNIETPEAPYVVAAAEGLAGRLSQDGAGSYYSTLDSYSAGAAAGVHTLDTAPKCELLSLATPRLSLRAVYDPTTESLCDSGDVLTFYVCEPAHVTLDIFGETINPPYVLDHQTALSSIESEYLAPGLHTIRVPFGKIGQALDTVRTFTLRAVSAVDPLKEKELQGTVANSLVNRAVLPVGHTFVKGVDLMDGHLVRQATDMSVPGRHIGIEVTRSYSSAARNEDGVMGAGWSWNFASAVTPSGEPGCAVYNVATPDGSSQTFHSPDDGETFTRAKGYHTDLTRDADTGEYVFTSKAGVRYHYTEPVDPQEPDGPYRLDWIEDPHEDRVEVLYDLEGRPSEIREVDHEDRPVRSIRVRYREVEGYDRIESISSSLGHYVTYEYGDHGNLMGVVRHGRNLPGEADAEDQAETYAYWPSERDPHQLSAVVDANQTRVEYEYFDEGELFPGEGNIPFLIPNREEFVKRVIEAPANSVERAETVFEFDYQDFNSLQVVRNTVTDPRGNDTFYELNLQGSPERIEQANPGGLPRITEFDWYPNDILKEEEREILPGGTGQVRTFSYDVEGNLETETVTKDGETAVTTYAYDLTFNKLTYRMDAEGNETSWSLTPDGDIDLQTDGVGNVTDYEYDDEGVLESVTDPRGHITQHIDPDSFGRARAAVRTYLQEARPLLAERWDDGSLFLSRNGRRLREISVRTIVKRAGEKAGLEVTTHVLRHSYATHLLKGGADVRHVQKLLGHKDISTTALYTKVDATSLGRVLRRCHPRGR